MNENEPLEIWNQEYGTVWVNQTLRKDKNFTAQYKNMDTTLTTTATQAAESLCLRLKNHYQNLDSHKKDREGARLIDEARECIEGLLALPKPFKTYTPKEMIELTDEELDEVVGYDKSGGVIWLNKGGSYAIEISRIPDPEALVHWLEHLSEKNWMTSQIAGELIRLVYAIKGWNLYRRQL